MVTYYGCAISSNRSSVGSKSFEHRLTCYSSLRCVQSWESKTTFSKQQTLERNCEQSFENYNNSTGYLEDVDGNFIALRPALGLGLLGQAEMVDALRSHH